MSLFSREVLRLSVMCLVLNFTHSLPSQAQAPEAIAVKVGMKGQETIQKIVPGFGQSFRDADYAPEMVVVPVGKFMMGSLSDEEGSTSYEAPVHEVTIKKAFAVGKYEVTFAEWDACVKDGGCNGYRPGDEGWGQGRHPVINVNWNDAKAYVTWLSKKTGQSYRLLTESEWEYTARAGTKTPYWWGSSINKNQANYNRDLEKTVPVDSFEVNPWGLYNVHGNVWEWVEDVWHGDYEGAPQDGSAWMRGGNQSHHVSRGGSWIIGPIGLRSAYRAGSDTDSRDNYTGFRIARTL